MAIDWGVRQGARESKNVNLVIPTLYCDSKQSSEHNLYNAKEVNCWEGVVWNKEIMAIKR